MKARWNEVLIQVIFPSFFPKKLAKYPSFIDVQKVSQNYCVQYFDYSRLLLVYYDTYSFPGPREVKYCKKNWVKIVKSKKNIAFWCWYQWAKNALYLYIENVRQMRPYCYHYTASWKVFLVRTGRRITQEYSKAVSSYLAENESGRDSFSDFLVLRRFHN